MSLVSKIFIGALITLVPYGARAAMDYPVFTNDTTGNTLSFNDTFGHTVTIGTYNPANGLWTSTGVAGGFTNLTVSGNATVGGTTGLTGQTTVGAITATGLVNGAGIVALLASPGPIGSTAASTGAFTNLSASGTLSGTAFNSLISAPPLGIGSVTPNGGAFTTLSASGAVSGSGFANYLLSPPVIGNSAPNAAKFTTLTSTGLDTVATMAIPVEGNQLVLLGADYVGTSNYSGGKYAYGGNAEFSLQGDIGSPLMTSVRLKNQTVDGFGYINWCFNDKLAPTHHCWGIYSEARRYNNTGATENMEIEISEFGTSSDFDPYSQSTGGLAYSAAIRIASGGGCVLATQCWDPIAGTYTARAQVASVALLFGNNDAPFRKGLIVLANAINGSDGHTVNGVFGPAITLSEAQSIDWQSCTNITSFPANCAVNNITARISTQQSTAAIKTQLIFADTSLQVQNASGVAELSVINNASDTGGLTIAGAGAGNTINLATVGTNASINIALVPKSTGLVISSGPLLLPPFTVATMPGCTAGVAGQLVYVTDLSTTPGANAAIGAGGGSNKRVAVCNGAAWFTP